MTKQLPGVYKGVVDDTQEAGAHSRKRNFGGHRTLYGFLHAQKWAVVRCIAFREVLDANDRMHAWSKEKWGRQAARKGLKESNRKWGDDIKSTVPADLWITMLIALRQVLVDGLRQQYSTGRTFVQVLF
jgi:hypothetical protein